MLRIGSKVPTFTLPNDQGQMVSIADYIGQYILIYFYPKDNTSGCTQQACDFRDRISTSKGKNLVVLGISRDSVLSHQKFKAKYNLSFSLLADIEGIVCNEFGVWVEKSMYGKKCFGIERSSFLISPQGELLHHWPKVKVKGHVDEVFDMIEGL